MEFFYVVKATQKSGKEDAVIWFTAKSEARANLQLDVELEDAGIETGRGKDYAKPVRTDFPVYDDLPEESTVDYTWCKRYELDEDQRTWKVKLQHEDSYQNSSEQSTCSITVTDTMMPELLTVATLPLRQRILAQFISDEYAYHIDTEQKRGIQQLEMDVDNSYVQNMLLAAENVDAFKKATEFEIARVVEALKTVFPLDGKRTELSLVIHFFKTWFNTEHIDRGILVREWANGNRISNVQRTDSGTNADGGHVTDRGEGAHHTLDTLDLEIACALLPMDFHHFEIPSSVLRRAKEIVAKKEDPWKSWSAILRNQPGILAVNRAAIFNLIRIAPENIHHTPAAHLEFVNKTMTAEFNSAVELLPLSTPAVETEAPVEQPQVENLGSAMFSIDGLMGGNTAPVIDIPSNEVKKTENTAETTSDVQMETAKPKKVENTDPVQPGEGADAANTQAVTVAPEEQQSEPVIEYPAYFEPGRYEGLPNDVYHAANGLSSTQIKDARVSLMYFNVRHVAKTISQHDNPAFIFGRATHSFVLEPEKFSDNYVLPEKMPEDVVSTTGEMVAIIKEYNATLPALMTPDELKAWIEEYNGNLTPPLSLSAGAEETANSYMSLPEEFQRIPAETKPTATAMKACIKEYNASLKPMLKTSGTRDQLLDQIATVAPEFAEQERAKFIPYNVSGTKEQLSEIVRTIRPDVVFADDWHAQQEAANAGKETISVEMYELIKNINDALQSNNDASRLLNHPARQSEVSYFGFDEETGLEVRVRPDIEIRLPYESICADLKTVSLGYVRQDKLKDRLHREIIDRDYHLSAAMYCDVAGLDKFTWIFVNKDPGYHWVAVVDASPMLLELGRKEYRRALRQIEEAMETGYWPAPITEAYTDDLNDYDTRRLEALDAE
ncbi:RecE family exodeoxyribonuclease [Enterobacter cloacae]|uniref:RecE family exodeoxyribonuclease n=1 Tax=Enterobacter cloacae TaxID=550 RepID=UPI0032DB82CD